MMAYWMTMGWEMRCGHFVSLTPTGKVKRLTVSIVTTPWAIKKLKDVCPGGKCQRLEASIAITFSVSFSNSCCNRVRIFWLGIRKEVKSNRFYYLSVLTSHCISLC